MENNIKPEVIELVNAAFKFYKGEPTPEIPLLVVENVGEIATEIIAVIERNKMTYTDAYAILSFVHGVLKFKSERTYL